MKQPSNAPKPTAEYRLESPEATQQLAKTLASQLKPGHIIFLEGNLGTGKTFFSQALIRSMGYIGKVLSPTYSLVHSYDVQCSSRPNTSDAPACGKQSSEKHNTENSVKLKLHHFDLYRLASPEELEFIGVRDYLTGDSICLIEWPNKGEGILPPAHIHITLEYLHGNPEGRIAKINYC